MPNKFVFPIAFLFLIACLPLYGQNNIERDRVGYYPLDGDGRDLGKYKNSGELIGTPEIAENRIGEKEAIAFDGDDWIVCSPNPMSIRSAVSVSLWVKTTDDKTKTVTLVGKYNPREFRGFNIIMKYGKISIGGRDGTKPNRKERRSNFRSSKFSDTMIADGKWHHVVGMVSDDTWSIYVDGLLESKQHFNTEKTLLRNTAPLVIGNASFEAKESSDFRGLDGVLDDLMLFKRALTAEEIQTLAQDNFFSSGMDSEANEILQKGIQAERIGLVDSSIIYFDQASVLYQKLKSDKERALALALAARNYLADNNVAMAIEKNLKSLFLTTNLKEDNSGEKGLVTQQQLLNLTQHNIAKINFFNGDLENANSKLNFPINRKNTNNFYSDEIAKIYLTKAEAFYEMGDYRKTTDLCKDSVLFFLENKEDHEKLIAENEMMHGRALIAQGKTQEGIQKLVKARQFFQTIEEGKNVQVIRSIKYLAEGYLKLNNKQKALELIQTALIKNSYEFENQSVANNPNLTDFVHQREAVHLLSLKASSLYEYSKSNPKDASPLEIANKTCYLASEVLANLNDELNVLQGPRMEIRQQFIGVYKRGIQIAYELYRTSKNEYYLYQAFYFSEMSKNSFLLEAVLGNLAKSENTLSNDLLEKERELRQNYFKDFEYFAELQNQGLSFYSSFNKEQENQLTNARKLWQEFSYKLQNEYLNYQKLRTQPIIAPFKEIRKKLSPTEIIVEYAIDETQNDLYIFLISKTDFKIKKLKWSKDIESKIDELYQLLQDPVELQLFGKETYETLAFQLYEHLVQPIAAEINSYQHLKFVIEGALNYVPFEALLTNNQSSDFATLPYLLRKYEISYHYSTTLLNALDKKKRTNEVKQFFGFAPIQFSSDSKLADLKASEEEIEKIGQLFQQKNYKSILIKGKEASQTVLKNNFNEPHRIFHIASHTNANIKFPLNAEIACADGEVKIGELYNLKLQADLLVLSSCKSGVGKLVVGEGMQGLNRNFIAEGVPNIMFSLWEVDDIQTKDLMIEFYNQVLSGKTYSSALQKSKLKMIQKVDVVPTFWSGFIFVGK